MKERPHQYFEPATTAAIYENPVTGWRDGIPDRAWLWMLLFFGFYMAAHSLWRPLIFSLAITFVASIVFSPLLFLIIPGLWITAAVQAQNIFRDHYTRLGWYEIDVWHQHDEE